MTRAIAFDLDGTLAESKSPLTSEMGVLVAELVSKMPVAVMSGGSYQQFQKQFLSGMPTGGFDNLYLFPTSAGRCYRWKEGEWKLEYDHSLSEEEKTKVMTALSEALVLTGLDKPPAQLWGPQIEDRGSQISWSALGQEAPWQEKKSWDPDRSKRAPLAAELIKRLPDFSIRVNAATTIDITRQGISKAYGVREWSKLLKIPVSEMLYVGDALFPGGNDEIVKESGIPTRQVAGPAETAQVIRSFL